MQWSDIDYMQDYRDFTFDPVRYEGLPYFVEDLHLKGMHYVPIIDAGIAMRSKDVYLSYDQGKELDIFMKINND